jgi:hypothetical protein
VEHGGCEAADAASTLFHNYGIIWQSLIGSAEEETLMRILKKIKNILCSIAVAALAVCMMPALPAQAAHTLPDSVFTQVPGSDIWFSPNVTPQEAYSSTSVWLLAPDNIRQRLINDNVKIYLIAKNDETLTAAKITALSDSRIGVAGLTTHPLYQRMIYASTGQLAYTTRVRDGMIEIQTDLPAGVKIDSNRVLHEIGHYVDSAAGASTGTPLAISSSPMWQNYYSLYASKIIQSSVYSNVPNLYSASECWADAFKLAYSNPAALQAISQDLLNYVAAQTAAVPTVGPSAAS